MKKSIFVFTFLTSLLFCSFFAEAQNKQPIKNDKIITLQEADYALNNGRPSYPTPQIIKTLIEIGPLFDDPTSFIWVKYQGLFFALSMDFPIFVVFKPNGELIADLNLEPEQ